jgi:hypothetical protein
MREVEGGLSVDGSAGPCGLAARSCEPLAPPEPEPVPNPFPVDTPRELEGRFEPRCPESMGTQGLEVPPSGACFLL